MSTMKPEPTPIESALDRFVLEWGRMSSSWGINRTMAQIHALLLATGKAYTVDEIMDELHISRGNASMNLRDLMEWGLIRRYRNPGDRKDFYVSHDDVWGVFARVARERKRREIDPTVGAIEECLQQLPPPGDDEDVEVLRARMEACLEVFGLIARVFDEVFRSDSSFLEAVGRLKSDFPSEEGS